MYKSKICLKCLRVSQEFRYVQSLANLQSRRYASSFTQIRDDLMSRRLPIVYDNWDPLQSELLRAALIDFLPSQGRIDEADGPFPSEGFPRPRYLQPGFHLIYFPPASRELELLPDGTDPLQSPGSPYVRRMWAGGSIQFKTKRVMKLYGNPAACQERITDVVSKGKPGEEKIFITLERRMGKAVRGVHTVDAARRMAPTRDPQDIREYLSDEENCRVIENRLIVFMQEKAAKSPQAEIVQGPSKILKPALTPDFTHTLIPSPTLLYRFSGLTFNAHRIHLDKQYCQQIEHHRGLLVHGPLSLVIMMQVVKQHLLNIHYCDRGVARYIDSVEYRNLAPLYAEESMTVCVCKISDTKLEVWIQGPDGGVAVKGTVRLQPPASGKEPGESAESTKSGKSKTSTELKEGSRGSGDEAKGLKEPSG